MLSLQSSCEQLCEKLVLTCRSYEKIEKMNEKNVSKLEKATKKLSFCEKSIEDLNKKVNKYEKENSQIRDKFVQNEKSIAYCLGIFCLE